MITPSLILKSIKKWWDIIRPKTLFASICPVIAGLLFALKQSSNYSEIFLRFIIILTCAVSLQVLSNLINDYYDYKKGADKKGRNGFKRALAEGCVTINEIKKSIYTTLAISICSGAILSFYGGWPILLIGITAILFAWLYTATNYSLSYLGIADIFCLLYYGILAVLGSHYLLTDKDLFSDITVLYVGMICGLISMIVLMINNIRDIDDDKSANKKTFPVRFGKKIGETMILIYSLIILTLSFLAFGLSFTNIIFIPTFMLYHEVSSAQGQQYNKLLFKAGLLNVFFILLLLLEIML